MVCKGNQTPSAIKTKIRENMTLQHVEHDNVCEKMFCECV